MPTPTTVAVVNTNQDVVELLRVALERAGFVVVSGFLDEIRRGQQSLSQVVAEHDPSVLIYDLVPPYDHSWRFFEHLQSSPAMQGRRFIITSANAGAARELSGTSTEIYEILGKPYDIEEIVDVVRRAVNE